MSYLNALDAVTQGKSMREILDELKGYNRIAVRSSAIDEDSGEFSFAGMLESYLDVPKEEIFEYIKKCYISCFSERIMEYRLNNNLINDNILTKGKVKRVMITQYDLYLQE